jgi:hypothetical protein
MIVSEASRPQEFADECDALEALIEEARRRERRRRRRYGAVLVLAALTGAVLYALVGPSARHAANSHRAPPLGAAATPRTLRTGRYWYVRRIAWLHRRLPLARSATRAGHPPGRVQTVWIDVLVSDETWVGVDGTMREREVQQPQFASAGDRSRWRAAGMPPLAWFVNGMDEINIGDGRFPAQLLSFVQGVFTDGQLVSLPTAVVALRDRIERTERAFLQRAINGSVPPGNRHREIVMRRLAAASRKDALAISELQTIGDLLVSPVPTRLRRALVRVAATIPGVRYTEHAHDSLGRPAIAVSAAAPRLSPVRLLLDPTTGQLLGGTDETIPTAGAVVAQGVVDSTNAVPKGLKPIKGIKPEDAADQPPEPQTLAISPAIGNRRTIFRVTLPAPARPGEPGPAQPRLGVGLAGPISPRGCSYEGAWPMIPTLSAGASSTRAGNVSYTYRLKPPPGNSAWCKGRYQLQVAPKLGNDAPARGFNAISTIDFQVR